jgi:phospholipase D1/2
MNRISIKSAGEPNKRQLTEHNRSILVPGRNCWRIVRADRLALIVDAEHYFRELRRAMIKAHRSIMMIGWDFDLRIHLDPEDQGEWPAQLGRLINRLVKRKPELEVRLLKWDLGAVKTVGRGSTPLFMLGWLTDERITLKLDSAHPAGSCHHQKIVVVDDVLAFCGGIDVTIGRWDTRQHRDQDRRRKSPWGFKQPPWHDATVAVSGDAARALGDLARQRWRRATGENLKPPRTGEDYWPAKLRPLLQDVDVAISRTLPKHKNDRGAREIETLYLDAIRCAQHTIYIETQYLASRAIGEALAQRLEEKDGPEIVIVNPESAEGWLEETVMGPARAAIVSKLEAADRHDRFRLYCPVTARRKPIYVHAKIMIVDKRLLRVGSSNLNNRSMGFDTECDLAIEAIPGHMDEKRIGAAIESVTNDLLAEHLGALVETVAEVRRRARTLIGTIEQLSKPRKKRLVPLRLPEFTNAELSLAESHLLDPERPRSAAPRLRRFFRKLLAGSRARSQMTSKAQYTEH